MTLHGCTLGSRILVGMCSTVMDGAVIEDEKAYFSYTAANYVNLKNDYLG